MPNSSPSLLVSYARILLHRRAGLPEGGTLPSLTHESTGLGFNRKKLARYSQVCGLTPNDNVPLLYPQVLAMPLHMRLIGDRRMPIKALGLVHIRNHVQRYRHLSADLSFDLRCRVLGHRRAKQGLEIDLGTELWSNGQLYWQGLSTYLRRGEYLPAEQVADELPAERQWPAMTACDEASAWAVPGNAGWLFAAISGDFNPIHVSSLAARSFGFPQAIAHGMWLLGRSLAGLQQSEQMRLDVRFSAPALLGMSLTQQNRVSPNGTQWQLLSTQDEPRVLLHARIHEGLSSPLFATDR